MKIFGYTLPEVRKAIVALVGFGVLAAGYLLGPLPHGFAPDAIAIGMAIVGFIAVVGTKNATADAIDKAVMAVVTAGFGMASLFATVPHLTELEQVIGAAAPFVIGLFVHQVPNVRAARHR